VFAPVNLDDELLPENSMIEPKSKNVSVNDSLCNKHSAICSKYKNLE
jgi:hypothetical protein